MATTPVILLNSPVYPTAVAKNRHALALGTTAKAFRWDSGLGPKEVVISVTGGTVNTTYVRAVFDAPSDAAAGTWLAEVELLLTPTMYEIVMAGQQRVFTFDSPLSSIHVVSNTGTHTVHIGGV